MAAQDDGLSDFLDGASRQKKRPRTISAMNGFLIIAACGLLFALLIPARRSGGRPAARRAQCTNNLKQIALALDEYESAYKSFPPAYTVDPSGRPLHSWRTLILPYLDQQRLYETIDLSKPWDDPANAKARAAVISTYQCPSLDSAPENTAYLAVVAPGSCFPPGGSRRLSEITDDPHETLMVIEVDADQAVPWMAPRDAEESMVLGIGRKPVPNHSGGRNAAFVSGAVRFLRDNYSADRRRAMISISGNDDPAEPSVD